MIGGVHSTVYSIQWAQQQKQTMFVIECSRYWTKSLRVDWTNKCVFYKILYNRRSGCRGDIVAFSGIYIQRVIHDRNDIASDILHVCLSLLVCTVRLLVRSMCHWIWPCIVSLSITFRIFTFDSLLDLIIASDNMHDTLTADELA